MTGRRILAVAVAAAAYLVIGAGPANAATTCTWGGTPDNPTGRTTNHPGLTNTPAPVPMAFHATGKLAGGRGCHGSFRFSGQMNAGSTCGLVTFQGRARGIRGVSRFAGVSAAGAAPARLYDRHGNVVGSENAQFLTGSDVSSCNTPRGMTGNRFSSVIVLLGKRHARRRRAHGPNRFEGTCRLTGVLHFKDPLGNLPRFTSFTDSQSGTCTGTLNGAPMHDLPVVNSVDGSGLLSCAGGRASTADTLTFARGRHGTQVHITTESAGALTQLVGHVRGAASGDGVVEVSLLPYTDQATLVACQAGNLTSARYDVLARTITPLAG